MVRLPRVLLRQAQELQHISLHSQKVQPLFPGVWSWASQSSLIPYLILNSETPLRIVYPVKRLPLPILVMSVFSFNTFSFQAFRVSSYRLEPWVVSPTFTTLRIVMKGL